MRTFGIALLVVAAIVSIYAYPSLQTEEELAKFYNCGSREIFDETDQQEWCDPNKGPIFFVKMSEEECICKNGYFRSDDGKNCLTAKECIKEQNAKKRVNKKVHHSMYVPPMYWY